MIVQIMGRLRNRREYRLKRKQHCHAEKIITRMIQDGHDVGMIMQMIQEHGILKTASILNHHDALNRS